MIYDKSFIEHIIELKQNKHEKVPIAYKILKLLFSFKPFVWIMTILEFFIKLILCLKIPVYRDFILMIITFLPGNPLLLGNYLRGLYWSKKLKSMGKNCIIEQGVVFRNPHQVILNDFVLIDKNVFLEAGLINIGRRVHIAERCTVMGGGSFIMEDYSCLGYSTIVLTATDTPNFGYRGTGPMLPLNQRKVIIGKVLIKKDCFIGPGVIIYPNIKIGQGAVVVSGSVVTRNIPDWYIVSGHPVKKRAARDKVIYPDV